jgi:hypothetical protein
MLWYFFDIAVAHVGFLVGKVSLAHVSFPVLLFSPVSIVPKMIHTHLHLLVTPTKRTKWDEVREPSINPAPFQRKGEHQIEKYFHLRF